MLSIAKARELYNAGCMDISSMHQPQYHSMLTPKMKIGLQYYKHTAQPIMRNQAESIAVGAFVDFFCFLYHIHPRESRKGLYS